MNYYVDVFDNARIVTIERYSGNAQAGPVPDMQSKVLTIDGRV